MRTCICLAVLGGFLASASAQKADDPQAKKDQEALAAFLAKNYFGKKWQTGPARIDSDELRSAHGKKRFCFVFSALPLPPGAFLKEAVERYQKSLEEYQKVQMSLTAAIDEDGTVRPLQKPEDYGRGLMKVVNKDDAKIAGAAVLSLAASTQIGPTPVAAKNVTVAETEAGWTVQFRQQFVTGEAVFGKDGKLVRVAKQSMLPLPPSALPPAKLPE